MKNLKDLLAENMHRFGTKNLNEDGDQNNNGYPDNTESSEISRIQKDWIGATTKMSNLAMQLKNQEYSNPASWKNLYNSLVIAVKQKNKLEKELLTVIAAGDADMYFKLTRMPLDPSL